MIKINEKILEIINTAENSLTIKDIKREIQYKAMKEAYGVSSFSVGILRDAVQELVDGKIIKSKKIKEEFVVFEKI
jgi:hypothetical protein